jgi:membrane-bound lytic murein transglycosylase A
MMAAGILREELAAAPDFIRPVKKIHSGAVFRGASLFLVPLLLGACASAPAPLAEKAVANAPPAAACVPCDCKKCVEVAKPEAMAPKALQLASWSELPGWSEDEAAAAWPAFRQTCKALKGRPRWPLWRPACEEAEGMNGQPSNAEARAFFEARFVPHAVVNPDESREGLITGYYEPLLKGSRSRGKFFPYPLLGVPDDLLTIDLGELYPELKHLRLRGRLVGNRVLPYLSRAELREREGELADKALLYVDDAVELFFLQIQGSGRVRLPDGTLVRVGYADQNGHPYQSIGRVLIERGELKPEQASMQGIQAWARAHPKELDALLNANPSFVFFRELPVSQLNSDDGPIGALGVPITGGRSLAVDPRAIPLGAPVFLATTQPGSNKPLNRLMLAQDTGGAIKGAVRADFFWGFGPQAGQQAGKMKQKGRMWVLLPPGHPLSER